MPDAVASAAAAAKGEHEEVLGAYGQRIANVLTYLRTNTEEEGGETYFDQLGLSVRLPKG